MAAFTATEGTFLKKEGPPLLFPASGAPEMEPLSELKQSVLDDPRATYINTRRPLVIPIFHKT